MLSQSNVQKCVIRNNNSELCFRIGHHFLKTIWFFFTISISVGTKSWLLFYSTQNLLPLGTASLQAGPPSGMRALLATARAAESLTNPTSTTRSCLPWQLVYWTAIGRNPRLKIASHGEKNDKHKLVDNVHCMFLQVFGGCGGGKDLVEEGGKDYRGTENVTHTSCAAHLWENNSLESDLPALRHIPPTPYFMWEF